MQGGKDGSGKLYFLLPCISASDLAVGAVTCIRPGILSVFLWKVCTVHVHYSCERMCLVIQVRIHLDFRCKPQDDRKHCLYVTKWDWDHLSPSWFSFGACVPEYQLHRPEWPSVPTVTWSCPTICLNPLIISGAEAHLEDRKSPTRDIRMCNNSMGVWSGVCNWNCCTYIVIILIITIHSHNLFY